MASIKYLIRGKSEHASIYLMLSVKRGKVYERKTGKSINPKNWSSTKKMPIQNNTDLKNLTKKLNSLKETILDDLDNANDKGTLINGEWLKFRIDVFFERATETNQSNLVIDAVQELINEAPTRINSKGDIGLSKSRINSYKALKRIFTEYQKNQLYKVKDVDVVLAKQFLTWMLNDKKYSKSYAVKKIADLKTVCNNAELSGIETNIQLKKIKSGKISNDYIIYLSPQELQKIEEANIINPAHQNARKWLLLGCDIGQRGGDLLSINESNFVNRNGLEVIELKQQKTGANVTIPILDSTKKILIDGLPYKISIQKFNEHIKKVCESAEIDAPTKGKKYDAETKRKKEDTYLKWELVTSHICRRSFATNQYGVLPTPLIMQITAHSTEKMFLNYIGKNALDYAQQIADFYELQKLKAKKEPNLTVVQKESY